MFPGAASAVSTPPTPFADRQSLEAELKALEKDLGDIQKLKAIHASHLSAISNDGESLALLNRKHNRGN